MRFTKLDVFRVGAAYAFDVGKGIARIPEVHAKMLNLSENSIIRISGLRDAYAYLKYDMSASESTEQPPMVIRL